MGFSTIRTMLARFFPPARLNCSRSLWAKLSRDLRARGHGRREAGAFLLGTIEGQARTIRDYLPYDEVDPNCLQGAIVFDGSLMDMVWDHCAKRGLELVADIHTHPRGYQQSGIDQANPMVPRRGHLALILPDYAARVFQPGEIGIFELRGVRDWIDHSSRGASFFRLRWL